MTTETALTPYTGLGRAEWSALRERTPLPLTAEETERLRGLGEVTDLDGIAGSVAHRVSLRRL